MATWRTEYLMALDERDKKEKANQGFYQSYTKLADRAGSATTSKVIETSAKGPKVGIGHLRSQSPADTETLTQLRLDLAEAQRGKSELAADLKSLNDELQKLKLKSKSDVKRVNELASEKAGLIIRMKDRDEELKGKAKLLEVGLRALDNYLKRSTEYGLLQDVHDETVSLTLQLNMAEEQAKKLKRENKELVDRWMARMGEEADAMNNASKFS
ncbi:hypothetical protein MMC12_000912 [Toensbergia leucococca]|nr:hypothetical protein [Toensbergia leucococca]